MLDKVKLVNNSLEGSLLRGTLDKVKDVFNSLGGNSNDEAECRHK